MKKLSLDEIKEVELDVLLELDRICKKHNLTYMLAYGSALGAARHKGFIPWDDDIDVIMPRDDYERLYALFQKGEIKTNYQLTSYRNHTSTHSFFKLVDPHTLVNETYLRSGMPTGLWVDIFPMERSLPSANIERTWRACSRRLFIKAQSVADPNEGTSAVAKALKRVICPIARLFDPYKLAKSIETRARSLNRSPSENEACCWVCIDDTKASRCRYDASMIFPLKEVPFEGHSLPAPGNLDAYLTQCYGNWHELPPEKDRHSHFPDAHWVN